MERRTLEVVAGYIPDISGRFLMCRRPAGKHEAHHWEFAGGKIEAGETPEEALVREYREELNVGLEVGGMKAELMHAYEAFDVHIRLYEARIASGTLTPLEHEAIQWVNAKECETMPLCPADMELLAILNGKIRKTKR